MKQFWMLVLLVSPMVATASPKLKRYASTCGDVSGMRLVREMDEEANASLEQWYKLLDVQGRFVSTCVALNSSANQVGKPVEDFKAAKAAYLEQLKEYKKLNEKRPAKIKKLTKILEAGGDDDCRKAIQEELSMLQNREATIRNVNCRR